MRTEQSVSRRGTLDAVTVVLRQLGRGRLLPERSCLERRTQGESATKAWERSAAGESRSQSNEHVEAREDGRSNCAPSAGVLLTVFMMSWFGFAVTAMCSSESCQKCARRSVRTRVAQKQCLSPANTLKDRIVRCNGGQNPSGDDSRDAAARAGKFSGFSRLCPAYEFIPARSGELV